VPDYGRVLPRGSYINAFDFNSTQALAAHLREVTSNYAVWASYMRLRYDDSVERVDSGAGAQGYCDVAEYLLRVGREAALRRKAQPFSQCVSQSNLVVADQNTDARARIIA